MSASERKEKRRCKRHEESEHSLVLESLAQLCTLYASQLHFGSALCLRLHDMRNPTGNCITLFHTANIQVPGPQWLDSAVIQVGLGMHFANGYVFAS